MKFGIFKIFGFFMFNPTTPITINELSRRLNVSTGTAKHYCDMFEEEGLLISNWVGNAKQFRLNHKHPTVSLWKHTFFIQFLIDNGLMEAVHNPFYIYGSTARGDFDEKSDVDIFIIKIREPDYKKISELERKLGREITILEVPYYKLPGFKKKNPELINQIKRYGIYFGEDGHGL